MTPEQLEAIEGIDGDAVNRIQQAINSFYGQEYIEAPQESAPPLREVEVVEAPIEEHPAEQPVAEAASGEDVPENPESHASDTMVASPESAGDAGAGDHSGAESVESEVPEP